MISQSQKLTQLKAQYLRLCAHSRHIRLDIRVSGRDVWSAHGGRYFELQSEKLFLSVSFGLKMILKTNRCCNICTLCFQFPSKADETGTFLERSRLPQVYNRCPTTTADSSECVWQSQWQTPHQVPLMHWQEQ